MPMELVIAYGRGAFSEVVSRPSAALESDRDSELGLALHEEAHRKCFIANSVNFPVRLEPRRTSLPGQDAR